MDEVAQIRERVDLPSFISEYVPLKKMGRNFKANCPFHNEKTPSFVVSPERQIWHCFGGCNKGGDVYSFLMEYEKLEFIEALRILAKRTGIPLRESNFDIGLSSKKDKIYKLNKIAMDFYHYVLTKHWVGKTALNYLIDKRKLNSGLIETFMIGFSPKDGISLANYLMSKKNYKKEDLIEAGLAFYGRGHSPSDDGSGRTQAFDFFRNRVMFPLFDHRGNVVGFSGRIIEDPSTGLRLRGSDSRSSGFGGKYINTKETLVYHKGEMFFGLNTAKDEIKKSDKAIIMEGELDVISSFSIGIKNTVAVKGTALTESQVALLTRFTNNICLCFDTDSAGYTATLRSLETLEKKGANVTVVALENGKDADEAVKTDPNGFKKAVKSDSVIYDYIFSRTFSSYNKNEITGKRKISSELLPIISRIQNEIIKEHYLKKLSLELDSSFDSLVKEMERVEKKEIVKENTIVISKDKRSRPEMLEDYLFALIVQNENPKIILDKCFSVLKDYKFQTISYQKIIDHLFTFFKDNSVFNARDFLNILPSELASSFDTAYLFPLSKFEDNEKYQKETEKVARELRALFLKNKIKEISLNLKAGEQDKDAEKINNLEKELTSTISLLSVS